MTCASQRGTEIHKDLRPCSAAIPGCSAPSIPACLICSGCERTNREIDSNGSERSWQTLHNSYRWGSSAEILFWGLLVDEINVNWSVSFSPYHCKSPVFLIWEVDLRCTVPELHGQHIGIFYFTQAAAKTCMVSIIQDSKRPTKHVIKHCFQK